MKNLRCAPILLSVSLLAVTSLAATTVSTAPATAPATAEPQQKKTVSPAVGRPVEGALAAFLGEPKLDIQQVHTGDRFPNTVVAMDGTVLALFGGVKVKRSEDGGKTWKDLSICEVLPDGPQNSNYGCMGGLIRLPIAGKDILIFSNCDSPDARNRGTVWASFDGGKTWPLKRLVHEGWFAYSSLSAGRPGTKSDGWIYLQFENDDSKMARFNLSWLLKGEKTGEGTLPKWLSR